MVHKCQELTISSIKNGKTFHKKSEANESALQKIEGIILAEALITLGAVYGDDEWAICPEVDRLKS